MMKNTQTCPRPKDSSTRKRNRRPRRLDRCGAATVEFAFTLPIVIVLLFGSIEFAYLHLVRITAADAAYVGARRGTALNATVDDVRQGTASILNAVGIRGATITIAPDPMLFQSEEVTVPVRIPLESNSLISPKYLKGRVISRSCTLRKDSLRTVAPHTAD